MSAIFKDHFSGHAADYGQYRPTYPPALFEHLAALAPARRVAWDAASGNGQAARGLATRFERVVASDASREQVAAAPPHARIAFLVAAAEAAPLAACSCDLVTVAQALHWLDRPRFFAEVARVLRPGGLLAAWCYELLEIAPGIDERLGAFYAGEVGTHWPPERALIEEGYRSIELPFEELAVPAFAMRADWTLAQLVGYVGTWSAVQRYRCARGEDPLPDLEAELAPLWGEPESPRSVTWPLALRIGRHGAARLAP